MVVDEAVTAGYRRGNILAAVQPVTALQMAEGVALVNELWASIIGFELGENLLDWPLPPKVVTDYAAEELPFVSTAESSSYWLYPVQNSRLLTKITTATTVKFPASPDDGARMSIVDVGSTSTLLTLDGNSRLIEGATLVVVNPITATGSSWFYRADLGSWTLITSPLAEIDDLPLPSAFDVLFTSYLAINLASRHSQEADSVAVEVYKLSLDRLKARYRQQQAYKVALPAISQSMQVGRGWFV